METITIPLKEYKRLRKCLGDAFKIFEAIKVQELQTPEPTPKKKRKSNQDKFLRLLENGGRMKKKDIVK